MLKRRPAENPLHSICQWLCDWRGSEGHFEECRTHPPHLVDRRLDLINMLKKNLDLKLIHPYSRQVVGVQSEDLTRSLLWM